jgi:two-component system, sensor histidine kinase and response regulator
MTKILVIEDAKDLREDMIEMLGLEGYQVYGAENGITGVEVARQENPDLIVCDIMMPILDGYSVLEKLRQDPRTATIPFIFLTAKAERVSMRHGMILGADDYLTKPFMVHELLDSIHTQLKKRAELNEIANKRIADIRENIATALPHELRTPLNTIVGFSDILLSEAQRIKPDQIAAWADHINKAAQRLYRFIENYLFYAKFQIATQNEIRFRAKDPLTDLASLIEGEAHRIAQSVEREADVMVEVAPAPNLHMAYEDAKKVIAELIDNAFKFSQPGQPVQVIGRDMVGCYELAVVDHGRGMTSEQIDEIGAFMQFERYVYEQQGLGLGLAIVQALAKAYGYEFHAASALHVGSTMTFRFKTR